MGWMLSRSSFGSFLLMFAGQEWFLSLWFFPLEAAPALPTQGEGLTLSPPTSPPPAPHPAPSPPPHPSWESTGWEQGATPPTRLSETFLTQLAYHFSLSLGWTAGWKFNTSWKSVSSSSVPGVDATQSAGPGTGIANTWGLVETRNSAPPYTWHVSCTLTRCPANAWTRWSFRSTDLRRSRDNKDTNKQ